MIAMDGAGFVHLRQGSAGICHVVDQDGNLVDDITDKHHATYDVGPRALLVDQGEAPVEAVGDCRSSV